MADWFVISDTALDPDAPLTSELAYAWRDNPIAIAEGAAGAPRIYSGALRNIASGTAATLFNQNATITFSSDTVPKIVTFGAVASGSVTITAGTTATNTTIRIRRVRNGGSTNIATASSGSTPATSVSFQAGDVVVVDVQNATGSPVSSTITCLITANNESPRLIITDMINV